MNLRKDVLLNILLPLVLGVLLYGSADHLPLLLKYYLADGLWAYAFVSSLLVIWERKINLFWISMAIATAAGFEILQYRQVVAGTGDVYDLLTYIVFITTAISLNRFFTKQFQYSNRSYE